MNLLYQVLVMIVKNQFSIIKKINTASFSEVTISAIFVKCIQLLCGLAFSI